MSGVEKIEGERCFMCDQRYDAVWKAPDWFWGKIVGSPAGCLCMSCFDKISRSMGIMPQWTCDPLWIAQTETQACATIEVSGWRAARMQCRYCKHVQISVFPISGSCNPRALECNNCHRMTCEPRNPDDGEDAILG